MLHKEAPEVRLALSQAWVLVSLAVISKKPMLWLAMLQIMLSRYLTDVRRLCSIAG